MLGGAQETRCGRKEEPVSREPFVKGLVCWAGVGRGDAFQRKFKQPLCQHSSIRAWQGRAESSWGQEAVFSSFIAMLFPFRGRPD
ncbi:hypothetical protein Cadr_000015877 [Camelus dromedarius]|uniref:Uncharacterized protein n=1 Tax=Camelus dromedarius TaxID=9838 RepID=A0A5N4E8K9_CAMDR|nr:hypothetical protein Cadr_000015877 [Camelus dromedarius]